MDNNFRIIAVIPAWNEEECIASTLRELAEVRPDVDVVVVDDGSKDNTADVVRNSGGKVIVLPHNLGIGGAVQTGMMYAMRHGYDVALQYDADGQHRPDQLEKMIAPLRAGEADMVLGSRFLENTGYKVSFVRKFLMWLIRVLTSMATGQNISDATSGFRAYGKNGIKLMATNLSYDFPEIETIIRVVRSGYRLKEVSTVMGERTAGTSMFTPFRATYFVLRSLMAVGLSVLSVPRVKSKSADGGTE